jgi:hypothetical protein
MPSCSLFQHAKNVRGLYYIQNCGVNVEQGSLGPLLGQVLPRAESNLEASPETRPVSQRSSDKLLSSCRSIRNTAAKLWQNYRVRSSTCLSKLAEREGFEPSVEILSLRRFSKPLPSATRPPLHAQILEGITPASKAESVVRSGNHRRGAILPQPIGEAQESRVIGSALV